MSLFIPNEKDIPLPPPPDNYMEDISASMQSFRLSITIPETPKSYKKNTVVPYSPSIPPPPPLDTPPSTTPQHSTMTKVRPYAPPPPSILPQHIPSPVRLVPKHLCLIHRKKTRANNPVEEAAMGCMLCMCWCCCVPIK